MIFSENHKDLAAIADLYRIREEAKKDYDRQIQELEKNKQLSHEYKLELAGKAKQELDSKIAGLNNTMQNTMKQIFDRIYSPKITVDSDLTTLLAFLRASGNALDKEQVAQLSEGYRGKMSILELIENVSQSVGIKDADLIFEDSFYLHKANKQPDGSVPDGYTEQDYLKEWQDSVTNGDFVKFSGAFTEVSKKLGEDIPSPVTPESYEPPKVI